MLHPTLSNHQTHYSNSKVKRIHYGSEFDFKPRDIAFPFSLDDCGNLNIISLNLARFPMTPGAPEILYTLISQNLINIYIFQEIYDRECLSKVFELINKQLLGNPYKILFSGHKHDRTYMAFAYRENNIIIKHHSTLYKLPFLRDPYICRPPDHLVFIHDNKLYSLVNIHGTPYGSHSAHSKRSKFFHLLEYFEQQITDDRMILFGGDWNFRPTGLFKYFDQKKYLYPEPSFVNDIDYFLVKKPLSSLYCYFDIFLSKSNVPLTNLPHYKDWNKIISDHKPVMLSLSQ